MIHPALERWAQSWRGPWLAAAIALAAGLPGVFALPPLDRDESRFAQASAQMLETGDFVTINFQDRPRDKKPVGIHWLQAGSVQLLSSPEARAIWAYRAPSLLGAMLAAAACAWGAGTFWGPRAGLAAGAVLGSSLLLSTEATIAKTDAVLCGAVTLMMAAFAHIYAASRGEAQAGRITRLLFWLGLAGATLVKGPVGPMVLLLTAAGLWAWDRKAPWLRGLGWGWGMVILAAAIGPWAAAISVATDGGFWTASVGGDVTPKLLGGHESHGAPPGLHLLLSPLLLFPATLLLPSAAAFAWSHRNEAGARFAIAWLVPAWLAFELLPTKLVHYTLPVHGAVAWLAAAALMHPIGRAWRWAGAALLSLASAALAGACVFGFSRFGDSRDGAVTGLCVFLFLVTGAAGAWAILRQDRRTLASTLVLGVLAHGAAVGLLAPRLEPLWLSQRVGRALQGEGLDPRNGVTPGPVAVAGYGEPSLVFALGTATELTDAAGAAAAIRDGRPAVVEARADPAFRAALRRLRVTARPAALVRGVNYSDGDREQLVIYQAVQRPRRQTLSAVEARAKRD